MAMMRRLPTRLLQHVARNHPLFPKHLLINEASCQSSPLFNSMFERYSKLTRGIQTQTEAFVQGNKVAEKKAEVKPGCSKTEAPQHFHTNADDAVKSSAISNLKASSRHDLAMVFTCKVCETRSVKTCCRESYENGVVVVRCGGCNNLHLMADRLGWFGEPGSIEDLLAARGDSMKRGSVDSLNFTLEDLAGKKF